MLRPCSLWSSAELSDPQRLTPLSRWSAMSFEPGHWRTQSKGATQLEAVLAYLPAAPTTEYSRGQIIYGRNTPSKNIYLIVTGSVGISHIAADGGEVLLEIIPPDELFGESAFLDVPRRIERAVALE